METYTAWILAFLMVAIGWGVTELLSRRERGQPGSLRTITTDDFIDPMEYSPPERRENRRQDKGVLLSKLKFMVAQKSRELAKFGSRLEIVEEEFQSTFLVRVLFEERNQNSSHNLILIILYLDGRTLISYPDGGQMTEEYYQPHQLTELLLTVQTALDTFQSEMEKKYQAA